MTEQTVTVGQIVRAWRRRFVIVLLCALAGGLLAAGYASLGSPSYTATAVVKLASLPDNPLTTSTAAVRAVNPATESQVVTSSSVAARAAELMKSDDSPAALSRRVTVTNPLDSQVLRIDYSAASARRAADGANAFAQAYLDFRSEAVQAQIDSLDKELGDQAAALVKQQEKAQKLAITSSDEVTRANAETQVASLTGVLEQVRGQRAQLAAASRQAGEQVGSAQPPTGASGITPPVMVAAGLAAGLVGGLVLALLRDRTDQRVRSREQIESVFGLAVIADVPVRRGRSTPESEDAVLRRLGAVIASPPNAPRISPLLLMPAYRTGSSDLPARLAAAVGAHIGTALLCSADAAALNLTTLEVSSLRRGTVPVRSFGEESTVKAGPDLTALADAEVLVVDGLNVSDPSTPLMLAPSSAAVLLVVRRRATRLPEIADALRELRNVGSEVHGVVLIGPKPVRRQRHPAGAHAGPMSLSDIPVHGSGPVDDEEPARDGVPVRDGASGPGGAIASERASSIGNNGWPTGTVTPPRRPGKRDGASEDTRPQPVVGRVPAVSEKRSVGRDS
ncbi:hypothetical protein KIH74_16475 [Kineosporia sp. J2-2]|uniref:Polysaccharide chain length determinant N-terminal domain-containing protein n=1 Tax=Kineosporia corallincola TaxID=2835133 RepID=A0ABS5THH0_9ACTN|nr:Wzz/FepE/Etk N-terminal domain-containing protein [Kineosporia corallincola]MBT0770541.1 hypothetical protein [Kineosporia corallincola]